MSTTHIAGYVETFRTSRIITLDSRAGVSKELSLFPSQEEGLDRETFDYFHAEKTFL